MTDYASMISPAHRTADAAEFGRLLAEAAGITPDDNQVGYWWDTEIPQRAEWDRHCEEFAEHIGSL